MNPRTVKILLAVLNLMAYTILGIGSWHIGGSRAADEATAQTLAKIKATCEDEAAPTVIDGTQYMCVTKPQWNKVLEFVFQSGAREGYKKGLAVGRSES